MSSDDEVPLPVTGASSSKTTVSLMQDSEDNDSYSDEEETVSKKTWGPKNDLLEWKLIA